MGVPDKKATHKSLLNLSCKVLTAKSMFSAFWLPTIFPKPATLSCLVVKVRFLNLCDSSTNKWSMLISLKLMPASFFSSTSFNMPYSFIPKLFFLISNPFSIPLEISPPISFSVYRFFSTLSNSVWSISLWISGDWGILPNWSSVKMIHSQLFFLFHGIILIVWLA